MLIQVSEKQIGARLGAFLVEQRGWLMNFSVFGSPRQ
jgi:hypothetical protein